MGAFAVLKVMSCRGRISVPARMMYGAPCWPRRFRPAGSSSWMTPVLRSTSSTVILSSPSGVVMKFLSSFTVPTVCAEAVENMNRDAKRISAPANGRNLALLFTIYPLLFGSVPLGVDTYDFFRRCVGCELGRRAPTRGWSRSWSGCFGHLICPLVSRPYRVCTPCVNGCQDYRQATLRRFLGGSRLPLVFGHPAFWNPSNDYNAYGLGLSIGDLGSDIGDLGFEI